MVLTVNFVGDPNGQANMKHLENTTYLKHLQFAWLTSAKLLVLVLVGLIHGLFPFILPTHVSSKIRHLDSAFDKHVG